MRATFGQHWVPCCQESRCVRPEHMQLADVRSAALTHGKSCLPEYRNWAEMWTRCTNPARKDFARYGGSGITVCPKWKNFDLFLADVGSRPSARHSLDRIDGALGYEPGNVRWATPIEQNRNRKTSRVLTVAGVTRSVSEWAELREIPYKALYYRVFVAGWDPERALGLQSPVVNEGGEDVEQSDD